MSHCYLAPDIESVIQAVLPFASTGAVQDLRGSLRAKRTAFPFSPRQDKDIAALEAKMREIQKNLGAVPAKKLEAILEMTGGEQAQEVKIFGKEYDDVRDFTDYGRKVCYIARKGNKGFIVHGDTVLYEPLGFVSNIQVLDGKLAFVEETKDDVQIHWGQETIRVNGRSVLRMVFVHGGLVYLIDRTNPQESGKLDRFLVKEGTERKLDGDEYFRPYFNPETMGIETGEEPNYKAKGAKVKLVNGIPTSIRGHGEDEWGKRYPNFLRSGTVDLPPLMRTYSFFKDRDGQSMDPRPSRIFDFAEVNGNLVTVEMGSDDGVVSMVVDGDDVVYEYRAEEAYLYSGMSYGESIYNLQDVGGKVTFIERKRWPDKSIGETAMSFDKRKNYIVQLSKARFAYNPSVVDALRNWGSHALPDSTLLEQQLGKLTPVSPGDRITTPDGLRAKVCAFSAAHLTQDQQSLIYAALAK